MSGPHTHKSHTELAAFERQVYDIYVQWLKNVWYGERSMIELGKAFGTLYHDELDDMLGEAGVGEEADDRG